MPVFDVHSYISVRVKVTGVEADTHEAAIQKVEDDNALQGEIARMISRDRPGDQIAAIEVDEGALAIGYLVDQQGDEEHENSRSFDVDSKGRMTEVGREPGARLNVSLLHRAALSGYQNGALVPLLDKAPDQRDLMRRLDQNHEGSVAEFIAKQLVGLTNADRPQALARLERAAEQIAKARDAVAAAPPVPNQLSLLAQQTPGNQAISVYVNGERVGEIVRPNYVSRSRRHYGLWRNASFCVDNQPVASGLANIMAYFRDSYGADLDLEIELHPGYYALYGPDGTPRARIITNDDGSAELRVFDPHGSLKFTNFASALAAARGI